MNLKISTQFFGSSGAKSESLLPHTKKKSLSIIFRRRQSRPWSLEVACGEDRWSFHSLSLSLSRTLEYSHTLPFSFPFHWHGLYYYSLLHHKVGKVGWIPIPARTWEVLVFCSFAARFFLFHDAFLKNTRLDGATKPMIKQHPQPRTQTPCTRD